MFTDTQTDVNFSHATASGALPAAFAVAKSFEERRGDKAETAEYLQAMLVELRGIAGKADMPSLAMMIDVAISEAEAEIGSL